MNSNLQSIKENIFKMTTVFGVSGCESNPAEVSKNLLSQYCDDIKVDNMGNVIGTINKNATGKHILFDSHNDQVGLIITHITEEGFIKFSPVGGIDRRVALGKPVVILGKKNIKGIISCVPPHLSKGDEKLPELSDMAIDTGLSYDELTKIVSVGDTMVIDIKPMELLNDKISSPALDDRASISAILRCLEILKDKKYNTKITVLFSAQEETSGNGAMVGSFATMPDEAIAIDVTHAKTMGSPDDGRRELGAGAMISYAPILDNEMSNTLVKLCKDNNINYGIEVCGGKTYTNSDEIAKVGSGIKCGLLSIPLKYMHTAVEVCDLNDVEAVAQLLAQYVQLS